MSLTEVQSAPEATEVCTEIAQLAPVTLPSASFVPGTSVSERATLPECAICLETSDPTVKVMLSCGHLFCQSCIFQYVGREHREHRKVQCPQCKRELLDHEVMACLDLPKATADELLADIQQNSSSLGQNCDDTGAMDDPMVRCAFEQIAHCGHMKCCPSCNALIEKNGGCDHMTCRCGHSFNWSEVPVLPMSRPCNCVHPHPKFGIWGTTCSNSSWFANTKLAARRAGLVTVGVPVVVFVAGVGGVAVLLVGGTVAGVYKINRGLKSAVENCGPDNVQARVAKAQLAVEEAERLVENASLEVQRQEQKWFNGAAIDDAKRSLGAKMVLLAKAKEHLEEIDPGTVETTQVTLPCCNFFSSK